MIDERDIFVQVFEFGPMRRYGMYAQTDPLLPINRDPVFLEMIDTWNNMTHIRNGDAWSVQVSDQLWQWRRAWKRNREADLVRALCNAGKIYDRLPVEMLILIAEHTVDIEWREYIDPTTAKALYVIDSRTGVIYDKLPGWTTTSRKNLALRQPLLFEFMLAVIMCMRHDQFFGDVVPNSDTFAWTRQAQNLTSELRWIHLED